MSVAARTGNLEESVVLAWLGGAKKPIRGFSIVVFSSNSADSDSVVTVGRFRDFERPDHSP